MSMIGRLTVESGIGTNVNVGTNDVSSERWDSASSPTPLTNYNSRNYTFHATSNSSLTRPRPLTQEPIRPRASPRTSLSQPWTKLTHTKEETGISLRRFIMLDEVFGSHDVDLGLKVLMSYFLQGHWTEYPNARPALVADIKSHLLDHMGSSTIT
ncbi:hypothetical protein CPB86DRAFT_799698 [Serendipita vermifera]|nr:hypothetical protein CPB86DRAFT_799698 [Serendipita vermifera]